MIMCWELCGKTNELLGRKRNRLLSWKSNYMYDGLGVNMHFLTPECCPKLCWNVLVRGWGPSWWHEYAAYANVVSSSVCSSTCVCVCVCEYIYVSIYIYIYIYIYIHKYVYVQQRYIYIYIYIYITHKYICICIYIYVYTYIHSYLHTNTCCWEADVLHDDINTQQML